MRYYLIWGDWDNERRLEDFASEAEARIRLAEIETRYSTDPAYCTLPARNGFGGVTVIRGEKVRLDSPIMCSGRIQS